ncbi:MAG: DUF4974 domain-containing protein [Tannerella sp.]|jgi:ferric-dicitrate binding protein FerR (iron transport regulator)|nr:DUF4974 domain-containing protein [Tannerella sp.]
MYRDELKERLIDKFLMEKPPFTLDDIDVIKAEEKMFSVINKKNHVKIVFNYLKKVAAIIVLPLILYSIYKTVESKGVDEVSYQELSVPYGINSQISLPDGTKVWLNGGSTLKFPNIFIKGKREVTMTGEGCFEVNSDKDNPFIINTLQMKLIAIGTSFNIEAYPDDSITSVTMIEGKVKVSFNNSSMIDMEGSGRRIVYNNLTKRYKKSVGDPYKWYAWRDGFMIFDDDPLEYVFKKLSHTFNVEINIKDKSIAGDIYHATFEDESLDEILNLLEKTAPIRFVQHKRTIDGDVVKGKKKIDVFKQK